MHELDREKPPEPDRPLVMQGDDCLDVLIREHGDEPISTLTRLISLTTSAEHTLAHNQRHR